MRILKIIRQHRRDYVAIMVCEHCSHQQEDRGYDDENYHQVVIPKIKCKSCGLVASEDYRPMLTKYPDGHVV